ncbi:phage gp16-like protein [Rhizobium sp. PP-CC-2G-626]|nr:phage gp16-like protein [Rhizobium sp. PP-CC-2G-626]
MSSIAAIKIAQKQLGLDDDLYRAKLQMITGKSSTKEMTEAERQMVITEFRRIGFKPIERRQDGRQKLSGKYAGKLQALWIAAYNLGITRERDDAALIAFVKRQTGIDHVRWLKFAEDARKVVEAMKGWMAREGGVDWSDGQLRPDWMRADGYRIAWAQWVILVGPKEARIEKAFWIAVAGILRRDVDGRSLTPAEWIIVMNAFGRRVRDKREG